MRAWGSTPETPAASLIAGGPGLAPLQGVGPARAPQRPLSGLPGPRELMAPRVDGPPAAHLERVVAAALADCQACPHVAVVNRQRLGQHGCERRRRGVRRAPARRAAAAGRQAAAGGGDPLGGAAGGARARCLGGERAGCRGAGCPESPCARACGALSWVELSRGIAGGRHRRCGVGRTSVCCAACGWAQLFGSGREGHGDAGAGAARGGQRGWPRLSQRRIGWQRDRFIVPAGRPAAANRLG
jgi:hypothetical protein